jgi:DNA modification methylase
VPVQPYPGAHYATFPERLAELCILAGAPADGLVLDPFAGTGTVGLVAQRLGRRAILADLNAGYLRQALDRAGNVPLGLDLAAAR